MSDWLRALHAARDLNSGPYPYNEEYARGQAELICDLFGIPMEHKAGIIGYICHRSDVEPAGPVPTVGTEAIPIATVFLANDACAEWLAHLGADGSSVFNPDTGTVEQWSETTSQWLWLRLGNGDLMCGFFPQADAYDVITEQVERDYNDAVFEESLRTIEMTEEDRA